MYLSEKHISIREFLCEDIEKKVEWINNSENNQYLHYDLPLTYEKTRKWFENKDKINRIDCVIEYDKIPVGLIGLLSIENENRKAEFYISMGEPAYKRKGIATRSTCMLVKYAFEQLKLNKIYLNVDRDNIGACKMYEKVGFKREGVFIKDMMHRGALIDRVRYAILNENYELELKHRGD